MVTEMLGERSWVTDGGLETDLLFHRGIDLPEFAAFPLVEHDPGRAVLAEYSADYAVIARRAGAGLLLESATWRANPDWGERLGYDAAALDRVNRAAIELLLAQPHEGVEAVLVGGTVGPRGDGYVAGERLPADGYAAYHRPQLESFRAAGADLATAYTLVGVDEALGVVLAARDVGLPVAVSFTVETDGRLVDGTGLAEAIRAVDAVSPPDWFLVNCAHPTHVSAGLGPEGPWDRVVGFRPNASRQSHAELDAAEELDEGDPAALRAGTDAVRETLSEVRILGGCCGTDARHVAALWAG